MTTKANESDARAGDTIKWAVAVAVLAAGVAAFYLYDDVMLVIRVAGLLVTAGLAAMIAYQTDLGRRGWEMVQGSRAEVRRVVWPTRQETVQTTLAVLALVVLTGVFLWLVDMLLGWLVRQMIGVGG